MEGRWLDIFEILEEIGIPVAKWSWIEKEEELLKFLEENKEIVIKAISKDILHKSDVGAVKVGIGSPEEAVEVFRNFRKRFPGAKILAQEMIHGLELFLGAKKDPIFGWVISFGLGGIFVEVYKDVSMRLAPVDEGEAMRMMEEIKGGKILEGYRGIKVRKEEIARIISIFSKNLDRIGGKEIDINPLICNEKGCWAVDLRVLE